MGVRTLQQLVHLGEEVIVLEKDPLCPNRAYAQKHGIPVIIGNGREEDIFEDLNVTAAKSIVLATNDDLANLEMALDARKIKKVHRCRSVALELCAIVPATDLHVELAQHARHRVQPDRAVSDPCLHNLPRDDLFLVHLAGHLEVVRVRRDQFCEPLALCSH